MSTNYYTPHMRSLKEQEELHKKDLNEVRRRADKALEILTQQPKPAGTENLIDLYSQRTQNSSSIGATDNLADPNAMIDLFGERLKRKEPRLNGEI
jgi:hypothetical protein